VTITPQELAQVRRDRSVPALPAPRGPLTEFLFGALRGEPTRTGPPPGFDADLLDGEDATLALYCLYELHYRGFADVPDDWEWEPTLLALRARLERAFGEQVREAVGAIVVPDDMEDGLHRLLDTAGGRSLSSYVAEEGTRDQLLELHVHRSAYQLKEADPHSWALPRLGGAAKAALVEIQSDEYGQGVEKDMHAELFALTMSELGLDDRYGAYLGVIPAPTLATVNLASYFGLHRALRGALVGHLAVFEMTSVEPMGRYSVALRRQGYGEWARLFYDTHVVADAHHQTLATRHLAGGLVRDEPEQAAMIMYGAAALCFVERRYTEHLLSSWEAGRSSLLAPRAVG
jgi:hypothetical protein